MAQPLRRPNRDAFDLVRVAKHQVGLPKEAAFAQADRPASSSSSEYVETSRGGYSRGLAATGAATVVVLSLFTDTPIAGLAVLGCAIAIRWALLGFGNWILDNTL